MKQKGVCKESEKFYYNVKQSYNSYERKCISPDNVILLKQSYCKVKSFPLIRKLSHFPLHRTGQSYPTMQSSIKQPLKYLMILKYFVMVIQKTEFHWRNHT